MYKEHVDVAVIGGGIAGVSAAASISRSHSVALLEQESELAYHTTSRSAAVYIENLGGPVFHRLSTASRPLDAVSRSLLKACFSISIFTWRRSH